MNAIEKIREVLAPDIERLTSRIEEQLETSNATLQTIIANSLKTRGKMVRPILVVLTARLFGGVTEKVINAAAAVELLHNASLIHDDVVDASLMRRGQPTINAIWNNHVAVLVGDFFVSSSLKLAIRTRDLRIVDVIGNLGSNLSVGELDQVFTAYQHTLAEEDYLRIIDYKTASLFRACARMGACSQDADSEHAAALVQYAGLLGVCFQMRDDIFDYYSDPKVGKPTGNDLLEGKVTLPLLYALANDDAPRRAEMEALVRGEEALSREQVDTLIAFAKENGGIDYTYERMRHMRQQAERLLDIFPESENKTMLLDLFDFIIERRH